MKHYETGEVISAPGSHPAGVRGLKPRELVGVIDDLWSHPAGVRGLKRWCCTATDCPCGVAPRRGAWVETDILGAEIEDPKSRTPQGCVG